VTAPRLFRSPARTPRGRVTNGLEQTLRALRDLGRLEPVDAAMVALAREAAAQLQGAVADPDEARYTRGVLIARYLSVLERLPVDHADADDAAALAGLFAGVGDPAQPGPPD